MMLFIVGGIHNPRKQSYFLTGVLPFFNFYTTFLTMTRTDTEADDYSNCLPHGLFGSLEAKFLGAAVSRAPYIMTC